MHPLPWSLPLLARPCFLKRYDMTPLLVIIAYLLLIGKFTTGLWYGAEHILTSVVKLWPMEFWPSGFT